MNKPKASIGTEWKRPNGAVVRVTSERIVRGMREVELTPVSGGGRMSWKWDGAVSLLLSLNDQGEQTAQDDKASKPQKINRSRLIFPFCMIYFSSRYVENLKTQIL